MNNKQILMALISQVEKNGYKDHLKMLPVLPVGPTSANLLMEKIFWSRRYEIIFSHSFARALWGEEKVNLNWAIKGLKYNWQYHLQQMVLEKEPFKYLKTFLDNCEHAFIDNDGDLLDFCKKCNIKRYKV